MKELVYVILELESLKVGQDDRLEIKQALMLQSWDRISASENLSFYS